MIRNSFKLADAENCDSENMLYRQPKTYVWHNIACSMTHLKNSHNMKLDLVTEDAARTFSKKSWLFKVTFASIWEQWIVN